MSTNVPEAIPASPPRRSRMAAAILALVAAAALIAGFFLMQNSGAGQVVSIRVTKHSMLPESLVGSPDYYLHIGTSDKKETVIDGFTDTPIGNGLDFHLPKALEFDAISHIELMDKDVGHDDIRDRVDVRMRICRGQDYAFELIGPESSKRTAGIVALASGGAALTIAAILFVRSHAI